MQRFWGLRGSFRVIDLDHNYFLERLADGSDYSRAVTGGPWVILDHYLTVEPWKPNFDPASHKVKTVVAWIKVPGLSSELYQLAILKEIGNRIGRFIRVDYSTQKIERGRFAKAAVELALSTPLQTETCVDGVWYSIMYEHIPLVCFECGRAGHAMASCPSKLQTIPDLSKQPTATSAIDTEIPPQAGVPKASASNVETVEAGATPKPKYGEWILVPPKVRQPVRKSAQVQQRGHKDGVKAQSSGSRFRVLAGEDEHLLGEAASPAATSSGFTVMARPSSKGVAAGGSIGGAAGSTEDATERGQTGYTLSGQELAAAAMDTSRRISKAKKGKTKHGTKEIGSPVLVAPLRRSLQIEADWCEAGGYRGSCWAGAMRRGWKAMRKRGASSVVTRRQRLGTTRSCCVLARRWR
ncbi:hypothetical protein Tsubulata_048280 [Turnera subulata]|uniref:CCHC-type domain-containing protein n=1 Tax=Turnera subulata TaxID=218843 RepID=A0A9Q0GGP3_9ROSI|nr:hypothetical protein Tsubulata_048280 [Turnera subulata]